MSTVQVGFSPATGSTVVPGVAAGAAAAADGGSASPLGFLGALLDILSQSLGLPNPMGGQPQTGGQPGSQSGVAFTTPTSGAAAATDLAIQTDLQNLDLSDDGKQLLGDLVSALSALDESAENGQPLDPALEKKLSDTLDGLAGMLGITLPATPAADPAATDAVATLASRAPDAMGPVPPVAPPVPPADPLPQADAASSTAAADDFAAAVQVATAPRPPRDADEDAGKDKVKKADGQAAAATQADKPGEDKPAPAAPESKLGKLVDKLNELAEKLDTKSPAVAEKLQKLADVLAAADGNDAEAISRLSDTLDEADIEALMAFKRDSKPAPAPQPIAQPALPVAAAAVKAAQQDATETKAKDGGTVEKAAEPKEKTKTDETPELKAADKPADKPAIDAKPQDRSDFARHLADARADRQADTASQNQAGQQGVAGAARADAAVPSKAVHAAYQAPVQQVNMPQVAFEVVRQFHQGHSRFQIRLDPPELGRIDVRMHMDGDGNVQAKMTVERIETLDLMQRDQRHLEKALAQAGLDASKTSLEFSLRQNPQGRDAQQFAQQWQQQQQQQQQGGNGSPWQRQAAPGTTDALPDLSTTQYRGLASQSGVNLFV